MKVFLIGFMGSGKTSIGRELARSLNFLFFDTDLLIQKYLAKSIASIFRDYGEQFFRNIERKIIRSIIYDNCIIATGGGLPCFHNNFEYIQSHGISIYLKTSVEILYQRLKKAKQNRPLISQLSDEELYFFIKNNLIERENKCYLNADYTVYIDKKKTIDDFVNDILSLLKSNVHRDSRFYS